MKRIRLLLSCHEFRMLHAFAVILLGNTVELSLYERKHSVLALNLIRYSRHDEIKLVPKVRRPAEFSNPRE